MNEASSSPIEQYIIDIVREKRIQKGWSQKDLAYEMELSIGFIGNVENPKLRAKYNLNHINTLAKVFECSPKDFLPDAPLEQTLVLKLD